MPRNAIVAVSCGALLLACGVQFHPTGEGGAGAGADDGTTSTTASTGGQGGAGGSTGPGGATTSSATGGGQGGQGGQGGGTLACPSGLPGRELVLVQAPGGAYCIEVTETTVGDYTAFLTAASPSPQADECQWNLDYAPSIGSVDCTAEDFDLAPPDQAVSCVDWCDARDYCAWAGKRLCGAIGGGPGSFQAFADPTVDEWMHACSGGGTKVFPYGDSYEPTTCIGDDFDGVDDGPSDHPQLVTDAPNCEGGFPGLFGMSGHVWEWTDACEPNVSPPEQARCRLRGGSFWDTEPSLRCDAPDFSHFVRAYANKNHGVRCCADPIVQ